MRAVLLAAAAAAWATAAVAQEALECGLETLEQSFRWTREFQGVPQPLTWTVRRETRFSEPDAAGLVTARESLRLEVPEFRWRFQQYLGSARIDACETRFDVLARTPTATLRAVSLPLVVEFQQARCAGVDLDCKESANLIGECHRQKRRVTTELRAELDVDYLLAIGPDLETGVSRNLYPVYGRFDEPAAAALLDQVLDTGGAALGEIIGSVGQVSLTRFAPDIVPLSVEGGFVDESGAVFELLSEYRLSPRQLCRVRFKIEDFGARHRPAP